MTISTTQSRISYNGNGATDEFAFPYLFFENGDLVVILTDSTGADTTLILNTDYTITGAGGPSGGTVTVGTPPAVGERLTLLRSMSLTQETDYITGDPFPAESHERALDRLTMISQQQQEELNRSAKLPVTSEADANSLVEDLIRLADSADNIDTLAGIAPDVTAVADIDADVTTAAQNIAAIQAAPQAAIDAEAAADRAEAAADSATGFATRENLVDAWDSISSLLQDGQVVLAAGLGYMKATGATVFADIPDAVPSGKWTVSHFGAGSGGDDTALFSAAARSAPAEISTAGPTENVPRPLTCTVEVAPGEYTLSELVDVGNRHVIWLMDPAAVISGIDYINGEVHRDNIRHTKSLAFNTLDYACGQSFVVGGDILDRSAAITGVANTGQLASYLNRDKVGLFVSARANAALVDTSSATYTSTTVTSDPLSEDQLLQLRRGMVIDTKHDPRCSGFLDSWNEDGSTLTVLEWRPFGGTLESPLAAVTPTDGTGFRVNAFTKLWAQNSTAHLTPEGSEDALIGHEYSIYNTRRDFDDRNLEADGNSFWGQLMSLAGGGSYKKGVAGYCVSGPWKYGYAVRGLTGVETGFHYQTTLNTGYGFTAKGGEKSFVGINNGWQETFTVTPIGDIQLGAAEVSGTRLIDFRTGGNSLSYDVRLEASGGDTTNVGFGTFRILALITRFLGSIYPTADSVRDCGTQTFRWANVFGTRFRPGDGSAQWTSGSGSPEGVLTAPIGSLYTRTDGGAGTTLYVKESGSGNTGWVAK